MKQEIPTGVIIGIIAVLVVGVGLLLWRQFNQPSVERDAQGNVITGIDPSKMEKDPVKFKEAMDKLVQDEKAAKGAR